MLIFDPLHKWLGIPPAEQPPNHYRLLGIALFEDDHDVIDAAADKQLRFLHDLTNGEHAEAAEDLSNLVSAARLLLLSKQKKARYDSALRNTVLSAERLPSEATPNDPVESAVRSMQDLSRTNVGHGRRKSSRRSMFRILSVLLVGGAGIGVGIVLLMAPWNEPLGIVDDIELAQRTVTESADLRNDLESTGHENGSPPSGERVENEVQDSATTQPEQRPPLDPPKVAERPKADSMATDAAPAISISAEENQERDGGSSVGLLGPQNVGDKKQEQTTGSGNAKIPDEELQQEALTLIKSVFESDYRNAQSRKQRQQLANKMLKVGLETDDDVVAKFVLLRIARDVAIEIGDISLVENVITQLSEHYEFDVLDMKFQAYQKLASSSQNRVVRQTLFASLMSLVNDFLSSDRFSDGLEVCDVALAVARDQRADELVDTAVARKKEVVSTKEKHALISESLAHLERDPRDPQANLEVGKYKCFVRQQWDEGLRMLALGSDDGLSRIALKETAEENTRNAMELGDAWWHIAAALSKDQADQARVRASLWYQKALQDLTGLHRLRLEKRIAEVGPVSRQISVSGLQHSLSSDRVASSDDDHKNRPLSTQDRKNQPTPPGTVRASIPSEEQQAKSLKQIKSLFESEYRQAISLPDKLALAKQMLNVGIETDDDIVSMFVLLRIVRDVSIEVGDVGLAENAVTELGNRFDLDVMDLKSRTYESLLRSVDDQASAELLFDLLMSLVRELQASDRFDDASTACGIAIETANRLAGPKTVDQTSELQILKSKFASIRDSVETLANDASNPTANLELGKYRCFVVGQWEAGLARLAMGDDLELKALAQLELSAEDKDALIIGDGWWDAAAMLQGHEAEQAKERALFWYRGIVGELAGLHRVRIQKRMEEATGTKVPFDARPETPENEDPVPSEQPSMFDGRAGKMKQALLDKYEGTAQTQEAVATGLEWLKRNQRKDGSWSMVGPYSDGGNNENDIAATAMALLAFLGDGHTHQKGEYKDAVQKGMKFLISKQDRSGFFAHNARAHERMYAQAQATIAICELYAMTKDSWVRKQAQVAIDFAQKSQSPEGGWRYEPNIDSDTSVTGWFVMALESGRAADLEVNNSVLPKVNNYLDTASSFDDSAYGYQARGLPSPAMTAEGLLCRQYIGWTRDHPPLRRGIDALLLDAHFSMSDHDVYYWYYATQVLHHYGGTPWSKWNSKMRVGLPEAQVTAGREAGSWPPQLDRWGRNSGRLFTTCLSIYCLEAYYRHMPLYVDGTDVTD